MTHYHEQQKLRSFITRRRFMLSTSMLPFAAWAAQLDGGVNATTGVSGSSEIVPPKVADVLNVRGFEPLARQALPPAHFGYLATGIDDDRTLRRNEEAFGDYEIRARRCRGSILAPRCSARTGARRSISLPSRRCVLFTLTGRQRWRVLRQADRPR